MTDERTREGTEHPRNEQAVWQYLYPNAGMWCTAPSEKIARMHEQVGAEIRALYPRPADARVPEAMDESKAFTDFGQGYRTGWNECRAEMLRLLATPPAAKPEPCPCGEATCEEPWEPGCGLGRSEEHVGVYEQPKPAGDDVVLPDPAFNLIWDAERGGYYVSKPNIGSTAVYTPEQVRALLSAKPAGDVEALRRALVIAEAALSDIGDADREPGDDLAWCERRAAEAIPAARAALRLAAQPAQGEGEK